jgi:ParB family chromosome partitioning protein
MVNQKQLEFESHLMAGSVKTFMKDTHSSSRDLWQVDVELLEVMDGFNVRVKDAEYHAHIRRLANSMKEEGYFQDKPLAAFVAKEGDGQHIYVTDGHCRLEAVKLAIKEGAEIVKIPAVVAQAGSSLEDLTVALVRANDGKPLKPLEIAIVCKRLSRFGWEPKEIARKLDFSVQYVDGLLLLIASPVEVRKMVEDGTVAASTAIDTLRDHGDKALEKLVTGLEAAKAKGKARVTSKHIAGAVFKKEVKKAAPSLFITLREVRADPGYTNIGESLRTKLEQLMGQLGSLDGVDDVLAQELKRVEKIAAGAANKEPKAKKIAAQKKAPAAKKAAAKTSKKKA